MPELCKTRSSAEPMFQKERDSVVICSRETKSCCKIREDIHCKGTQQEEMLDILEILFTKYTTARTLITTGLKLIPGKYSVFF